MQEWMSANEPNDELIFKRAWVNQLVFLRDRAAPYLAADHPEVIGVHRSKSCRLPVVQVKRPGLTVTMRGNFYNWTFSVTSKHPAAVGDLVQDRAQNVLPNLCEGFPEELVYGPIDDDASRFTCHVWDPPEIFLWAVGLPFRMAHD